MPTDMKLSFSRERGIRDLQIEIKYQASAAACAWRNAEQSHRFEMSRSDQETTAICMIDRTSDDNGACLHLSLALELFHS